MLAICTGISGTDKWGYLSELAEYASRSHNVELEVLDLGTVVEQEAKRLFEQSHIEISATGTDRKVLDLPRSTARQLAATASEQVLSKIRQKRGNYVISTHVSFRWTKSMMLTADTHYIDLWKPDFFLTIKDNPPSIRAALQHDPKWKGKLALEEIAAWQQEEIAATRILAGYRKKTSKDFSNSTPKREVFDYLFKSRKRSARLPAPTRSGANRTIYCTSISGSKAREYLTAFCEWAKVAKHHRITLLDLGAKVVQVAQNEKSSVNRTNILQESQENLNRWRHDAMGLIRNDRRACGDCIILGHTTFRTHFGAGNLLLGFDPEQELMRWSLINPNSYVTIMDNILSTKIRLQHEDFAEGLRLDLREISMWRDEERFFTRLIAENFRKPHYILPLAEPFETLYGIAFDVGRKKSYLSFPITEVLKKPEKERTSIFTQKDQLRDDLRSKYVIFDPLSILDGALIGLLNKATSFPAVLRRHLIVFEGPSENPMQSKDLSISHEPDGGFRVNYGDGVMLSGQELDSVREHVGDQIVERDYYLIDQSDWVTVYYPVNDVSPGVMSEVIYGFSHGRDVLVWWYSREVSPFLENYATEICHSKEELMTKLRAQARK
jgi:adenylate kinase